MEAMHLPQLAITNQAFASVQDILEFCRIHDCPAVEYTFRRGALSREEVAREIPDVEMLRGAGLFLRYHLAFPGFDLGHPDPARAREAVDFHLFCLGLVADQGGDRVTLHIGLDRALRGRVDYAAAVRGLREVTSEGERLGVRVCLENLRLGRTGDPRQFQSLLAHSGAFATLDVGHARARELASAVPGCALDFIPRCNGRLLGAHVYEIEAATHPGGPARHMAPRDLTAIRSLLDAMVWETSCDWWLIELTDAREMAHTLQLLRRYRDGIGSPAAMPVSSAVTPHTNHKELA
ncbi:sugar phosphate isomerase/epimerase family protein [Desulfolutivibrio sulfoxidireducens]|uniref:sugar phosphate isomerase/epimerase family protein n=1 Tax=Desulfolutivibrio sulfoxidireducens TaxID=2773299 RepID=UPI00159E7490|nr:TIM barrel protein [Desulfolutivibrio sulfoxidireducens]QLA20295.1 hypothetical protein GD604_11490 [Desulfolutivibrio sulfoxidireducens]